MENKCPVCYPENPAYIVNDFCNKHYKKAEKEFDNWTTHCYVKGCENKTIGLLNNKVFCEEHANH
jgi:hypothetical protein